MGANEETTIDIFGATLTRGSSSRAAAALVVGLSVVGTGRRREGGEGRDQPGSRS